MTTSCRGLYRSGSGCRPSHVQVNSPSGHSIPLPIEEYESRGGFPDWRELPTEKQYMTLLAVHDAMQARSPVLNPAVAEECIDRGWLEPVGIGGWGLTVAGKRFL
jgi:hypothetical protein